MKILRTRIKSETWKEMADVLLAQAKPWTLVDASSSLGIGPDSLASRIYHIRDKHGLIVVMERQGRPKAEKPEERRATYRLTKRGRQVFKALSKGVEVPPPTVEKPKTLPPVETAWRQLRDSIVLPPDPWEHATANPSGRNRHLVTTK